MSLRIGFIGVGGVAQPHLKNVSGTEGAKVTAVCDAFADRAQQVGENYGASVYTDYKEMLANEELDGVYVCLIPAVHGTIEIDLIAKGLPFYVEKPVNIELDAAQRVLDALEKTPVINGVGYHWRYTKASRAVKEFASTRKIALVEGAWYGGMPGVPWWRQMNLSGGQLVEQTTHVVDMARYIAGEVKSVYAIGGQGIMAAEVENFDVHDVSVATLNFESGAIGQITSGCIAGSHGGSRVDITVKGREWFAWTNAGEGKWDSPESTETLPADQDWSEHLGNGDAAFLNALKSGDQSHILADYRSSTQSLAISIAANESMESGQVVQVRRFI